MSFKEETTLPPNPVRSFLTGLALFLTGLLWLVPVTAAVRHAHFALSPFPLASLCGLAFLLGFVSFCAHFCKAFSSAWDSYPCWRDDLEAAAFHNTVSLPNGITAVELFLFFPHPLLVLPLLILAAFELAGRTKSAEAGERFARSLINNIGTRQLRLAQLPEHQSAILPFPGSIPESEPALRLNQNEMIKFDSCKESGEMLDENETEEDEPAPPNDLLCTQNRFRNDDGTERIEGWFRVPFQPEESVSVCHLSFCPPFASVPTLELIQISGQEIEIKPTLTESFGARVEIKRRIPSRQRKSFSDSDGEESVRICFFASESDVQKQESP